MKKTIATLATIAIAAVSVYAKDFPKGSPKFEDSARSVLNDAKKSGKPIVMVFSAVWCGPCQTMKKEVYPSEAVKAFHDKFEWAYLDTDDSDNDKAAKEFGVSGIPHIQFLDASGKPIDKQVGSSSPESFAAKLKEVLAKAGKSEGATAASK
jgi:thioredoxin-like negative regulator of GroEL